MKLKKFRVHFEISGHAYREVKAFDEEDAREQVDNDRIHEEDCENVDFGTICVDDVEEVTVKKRKKK